MHPFTGIEEQYCGVPAEVLVNNESIAAVAFEWILNGDWISEEFNPTVSVNSSGSYTLALYGTNAFGCVSGDSSLVVVHQNPIASLLIDPASGCVPLEVYVQDVSAGSVNSWLEISNSNGTVYNGPVTPDPILFSESGTYFSEMSVVSVEGCSDVNEAAGIIEVWPAPVPSFTSIPYDSEPDNLFDPSDLNDRWFFENTSFGNVLNYWQFGDGSVSSGVHGEHLYGEAGAYSVTLMVTNAFGCMRSTVDVIQIAASLEVYVPNTITPGGISSRPDGLNDAFRAEFSDYSLISDYHLQIFNRWGEMIWETSDPEEFWLGELRRGEKEGEHFSQIEVYNWKIVYSSIILNAVSEELVGHVTVVR